MNTIIQHSLDIDIAQQISSDFKILSTHIRHQTTQDLNTLRQAYHTDFNALPSVDFSKIQLFVSDMDSTLITIECIDEIADFAKLKPQVSAITKRAMLGELDFAASLTQRVGLLKGLNSAVLDKVYTQRLQPSDGAGALIAFFKSRGIKSAVVSGGFGYFADRLADELGLDNARANTLEIKNGRLTGALLGVVIDAKAKAAFVRELCLKYCLSAEQVIVAGDGANDLMMMANAGLSVAYHAKPMVRDQANIVISFSGLDKIIDFFER